MKFPEAKALVLAVMCSASLLAQTTLTQSTNNTTITPGNSQACVTTQAPFTTFDNGYFRSYPLTSVGSSIDIASVRFGVELITTGGLTSFPVLIRLYADPNGGAPTPYTSLVLRHTESFTLPAQATPSIVTQAMTGPATTFAPGETLVVEVFTAQGPPGAQFYIGSNALGQSAQGYLRSGSCAVADPTSLATLGFTSMHMILDVVYTPSGQGVPYPGTNEDLTMFTGVNSNPLTTGVGNFVKTASAGNTVTLKITSAGNTFNYRELVLIAQGFVSGFPPFPPAANNIWMSFPGMFFLIGGDSSPFGPVLLPPGGTTVSFQVPPGMSGNSVIFQGAVVTWTQPLAANGLYASTDGFEFQVQ